MFLWKACCKEAGNLFHETSFLQALTSWRPELKNKLFPNFALLGQTTKLCFASDIHEVSLNLVCESSRGEFCCKICRSSHGISFLPCHLQIQPEPKFKRILTSGEFASHGAAIWHESAMSSTSGAVRELDVIGPRVKKSDVDGSCNIEILDDLGVGSLPPSTLSNWPRARESEKDS